MPDLALRLRRAPFVTLQATSTAEAGTPGAAILINPRNRVFYPLDAMGIQFWQSVDGQRTVEEIAASLARARGEHVEAIAAEPDLVVESLLRDGFLQPETG